MIATRSRTCFFRRPALFFGMVVTMAMLLISGCASLEKRIERNADYFATLPPERQALISSGEIDVGFSKQDVYLALGEADVKYTRRTSAGESEVWSYREYETAPPYFHDDWAWHGGLHHGPHPYRGYPFAYRHSWYDRPRYARDVMRVVFENGQVSAIEREVD